MQPIQIEPIKKNITIHFSGEKVSLPQAAKNKIDEHWQKLTQANPNLRNGEVFTVTDVQETSAGTIVQLAETSYAHYLYSHQIGDFGEHTVRIIHSAALVITSDDKLVFGAMGAHTSRPDIIQCCGGGIDHKDIHDGLVDIEHNTANELNEELGINPYDANVVEDFSAAYLKFGGPTDKMTVAYVLRTKQSSAQFLKSYKAFTKQLIDKGEEPEFGKLFTLDTNKQAVGTFIDKHADKLDEYMAILLRTIVDQD